MNHRGSNRSPWEIGRDHWDQRDLYTRNPRTDDSGYARGPSEHPDVGSYAYVREFHAPESPDVREPPEHGPPVLAFEDYYQHEAWPWLIYQDEHPHFRREGLWARVASEATELKQRLVGGPVASVSSFSKRDAARAQPSDEAIREEVRDALRWHRELDASDVEVTADSGEVTLRGTVHDPRSKTLAAEVAAECAGVLAVHNRIRVRHDDDSDMDVALVMPLQPV